MTVLWSCRGSYRVLRWSISLSSLTAFFLLLETLSKMPVLHPAVRISALASWWSNFQPMVFVQFRIDSNHSLVSRMSPSEWECCLSQWLHTTLMVTAISIDVIHVVILFDSINVFDGSCQVSNIFIPCKFPTFFLWTTHQCHYRGASLSHVVAHPFAATCSGWYLISLPYQCF